MEKNQNLMTMSNTRCWNSLLDEVEYTFKGWMREVVEDVITEKMCNVNLGDKRLTVSELCQRWNIGKNTLHSWEKNGIIKPLPLGGRKKVYSMTDILDAEVNGFIKNVC